LKKIEGLLNPGDCLVIKRHARNILRVFLEKQKTGASVELLLLPVKTGNGEAMMGNSRRVKEGESVLLDGGIKAQIKKKTRKDRNR
jgi:S-adenosylmethionine:tRNA-ribosyltransferase-isomerase (queuine synthetase)